MLICISWLISVRFVWWKKTKRGDGHWRLCGHWNCKKGVCPQEVLQIIASICLDVHMYESRISLDMCGSQMCNLCARLAVHPQCWCQSVWRLSLSLMNLFVFCVSMYVSVRDWICIFPNTSLSLFLCPSLLPARLPVKYLYACVSAALLQTEMNDPVK